MMTVLEAHNITKTYRRGGFFSASQLVPVLQGVNLSIGEGECVGLVGRSGSGKSTLGRILLGLEAPTSGLAAIIKQPTTDPRGKLRINRQQRRAVQVVFQDAISSVNPRKTAREIIGEPLRNFDRLRGRQLTDRVADLLNQVGLDTADMDKHPAHFSGGQLQRLSIARALAAGPRCIILDEAVSSLDMLVQARVLDLLTALRRDQGVAYLFITHDLRLIRRFCDRALAVEHGRVHAFDHTNFKQAEMPSALAELAEAMLPASPPNRVC